MSAGERPARVQTQPAQQVSLRAYFESENAENCIRDLRNMHFRALVVQPQFIGLMTSHISYQWRKFYCEFIVRRQVGKAYYRASQTLATLKYVMHIIFDIISIMYALRTYKAPRIQNSIFPQRFMRSCRGVKR